MNTIRCIDLFCGAGGSSYGARKAGAEIMAGFDCWEPAHIVFKANFPEARIYTEDIRELSPEQVKAEIGEIDLILASPECTSHSRAKGKGERSEASNNTAFEVIRFAQVFKPTWIVIENVMDMASWERYNEFMGELEGLAYVTAPIIVDAKDFNVPQSRERLFILCSLNTEPIKPISNGHSRMPVSEIIDVSGKYKFTDLRKKGRAKATIAKAEHAIKQLGKKKPFLIVYYGSGRNGNGGWQEINEPLRTITTLDRFALVVPSEKGHQMRMLQPEELKLAMGYGPEFKLDSVEGLTRRNRVKLMGNGVCPPVMEAIVKHITSIPPATS